MRWSVIGAGAWGTSMASTLATEAEVTIWAREPEVVTAINERHRNELFLPGVSLAPGLTATDQIGPAVSGADAVLVAVPAQHFRAVLSSAAAITPETPVLTLTKGIEDGSLLRMTQVAAEVLVGHDVDRIGVLSGPNIAKQVVQGQPAATVVALPDEQTATDLQSALMRPSFRVYTNTDVIGCEIGGAVKNVIALAAGMVAGLGFEDNSLAALVTRGLAELTRLGVALDGQPLTFMGLAGIGDLMVTCQSQASRNHHVGYELGRGRQLADVLGAMHSVAEGVRSCEPVLALGRRAGVELPICEQVGEVLAGRCQPREAVEILLRRGPTAELHGIAP